ncbi:MAG: 16S rRNA (guanine(527)-N(7))-methyltransferase RsmG [Muribaculaceae bacterium]|nr:16S rRNA (guanine(527)-N(7))-methyltransferase RsmG [Muribaculaceae bacterium]
MSVDIIKKYFKSLTDEQVKQFEQLGELYPEWNEKINVISRKDIENLYVNHILHSLGIAKFTDFKAGSKVLDMGTGGGLPGIPLAIMFPEVHFHLVDRIGKKIKVAQDIADRLGLKNVTTQHGDVKEVKGVFDFVVSRAVMNLDDLVGFVRRSVSRTCINSLPNGLICLKGGDLQAEVKKYKKLAMIADLKDYFEEEFFDTKKVVYVQLI